MPVRSLKFKRLKQRFGPTAPRVVVRAPVLWYHWVLCMLVALAAGWLLRGLAHPLSIESASPAPDSTRGQHDRVLGVDAAAQRQLLEQISALGQENASLREGLFAYERLVASSGGGLRVEGLRVLRPSSDSVRYRFYLGGEGRPLDAKYRLAIRVLRDTGEAMQHSPDVVVRLAANAIVRQEGDFSLRPGDQPLDAELALWIDGRLRTKHLVKFEGAPDVQ